MNSKKISITVFLVALVGLIAYQVFQSDKVKSEPISTVDHDSFATTTDDLPVQITISKSEDAPKPIPDLSRPINFAVDLSIGVEEQKRITEKITSLQQKLKGDPNFYPGWIDLGSYRKMIGDYVGSVMYWEYALRLNSKNYIVYGNLADLYAYYIHDNAKAEVNFKKAIENSPQQIYLYFQAAYFYRDVLKDTDKAKAIVRQGIKANPLSAELESLLNSL